MVFLKSIAPLTRNIQRLYLVQSSCKQSLRGGYCNNLLIKQCSVFISAGGRSFLSTRPVPNLKIMKLETQEFKSLFSPELKVVVDLFSKNGYELRIAGGAVRDLLAGQMPHDLDFATTATPEEMIAMFEKEEIRMLNMGGLKHGTVTCRINDKENFEVTTLRIDVVTDGRHAEVQFTQDWELDALRRDLTINAMFLGFDGTVYDYFDGAGDLKKKKVRFVGNAVQRIQEDFLRILRYFRFYGRIAEEESNHDLEAIDAIRDNIHGLAGISGERIWVELKKILVGNHAAALVNVMMKLGMGQYIGLTDSPDVEEFSRVWAKCGYLEPLPLTVLAALMKTEDEVYKMNERLKLSREELRLGLFIVQYRYTDLGSDPLKYCKDLLCDVTAKEPKSQERIKELLKYKGENDLLKQFDAWKPPRFPVSGFKMLERGVKKGPILAKTLNALRRIWKESDYTLDEEELLDHVERLKTEVK